MVEYYLLVGLATVLYSVQFVFTKMYQKRKGDGVYNMLIFNIVVAAASLVYLLILNGFKLEYTWFTLLVAGLFSVSIQLNRFFSVKLMARAGMAVFTLVLMLGGMLVPFFYGVVFLGDEMNAFRIAALILMIASIVFLMGKGKSGEAFSLLLFLFAVITFFTNGFSGMLLSLHQKSDLPKADIVSFNAVCNIFIIASSLVMLAVMTAMRRYKSINGTFYENADSLSGAESAVEIVKKPLVLSWAIPIVVCVAYAAVHASADLIQTFCYNYLDVSVETTIITGGCIIFGTLAGLPFGEKIGLKTLLSIVLATAGTALIIL